MTDRLSLTTSPIMAADVTGHTLYYTDGFSVAAADVSTFAVGVYDVFIDVGPAFRFQLFNAARHDADYVGSINVSVQGQLTCHFSQGPARKFEVYNALNQRALLLSVITEEVGLSYLPANQYPAFVPFNNNPHNCGTIVTGLPERVDVSYAQSGFLDTQTGSYGLINAIGWDNLVKPSGNWGFASGDSLARADAVTMVATYCNPAALGANTVSMLIAAAVNSSGNLSVVQSAAAPPDPPESEGVMYIRWNG